MNADIGRAMAAVPALGAAVKVAADFERAMAQVAEAANTPLTLTRCSCGRLVWFGNATAVIQDGTLHAPEDCEADQ